MWSENGEIEAALAISILNTILHLQTVISLEWGQVIIAVIWRLALDVLFKYWTI